jgi:hypothetical protein
MDLKLSAPIFLVPSVVLSVPVFGYASIGLASYHREDDCPMKHHPSDIKRPDLSGAGSACIAGVVIIPLFPNSPTILEF